jgi:maleamate amidohydrolase
MALRPWDGVIPPEEIEIYKRAGFGSSGGFGQRPAVIVIDAQYMAVGSKRVPIQEAMNEYPHACGEYAWKAIDHIVPLLTAARSKGIPVYYPVVAPRKPEELRAKAGDPATSGRARKLESRAYEVVDEIAPADNEIVIPKKTASAFYGTDLVSHLIGRSIDTVFICGCTTSGCVRATSLDAYAKKFRTNVVEECVWDRSQVSHAVNLFDLDSKYADVRNVSEVIDYFESL